MLKGIAASSGITIAKVQIRNAEIIIEYKQCDPQQEIEKFNKAVEVSKKILQ